jgi:hypothetical protein
MTARDFRDEQEYFLARRRLHLRALHGWGVVCGLEIEPHPDADCRAAGWVVVRPGIAVDCHGREVILTERTPVCLPALMRDDAPHEEAPPGDGYDPNGKPGQEWDTTGRPDDDKDFLLGIRYAEVCVEPVPVLIDESGCRQRTTPNRVREQPAFRFRPYQECDGCWLPHGPNCASCPPNPGSDFPADCDAPPHDFTRPLCPCGDAGFVPLARFKIHRQPDGAVTDAGSANRRPPQWDVSGRRYLFGPLHPFTLTHICGVNWAHGGTTNVRQLQEGDGRKGVPGGWARLVITFDRPLCESLPPAEEPGWLVEEPHPRRPRLYDNVLRVEFEHQVYGTLPLAGPDNRRYRLSDDRKQLYYEFETSRVNVQLPKCEPVIIRVALNCDFLPDEYGRAVDGNHLRGSLGWAERCRTGDGVEGGVFESWFQLTGLHDQEARQ